MRRINLPDLLIRLYMMEVNLSKLEDYKAPEAIKSKTEARVRQLRQEVIDKGLMELYERSKDELWLYYELCEVNTDFRFECLNFAEHVSTAEGVPPSDPHICPFGTHASTCGPLCPHWQRMTKADRVRLQWEE